MERMTEPRSVQKIVDRSFEWSSAFEPFAYGRLHGIAERSECVVTAEAVDEPIV